jgi:hypothetical protein
MRWTGWAPRTGLKDGLSRMAVDFGIVESKAAVIA